jgi:hypothetical protein
MKINFEPVFKMLNEELSDMNQSLELICAGGYVMQLHGHRATVDVDAFYKSNAKMNEAIRKVGDAFGINRPDELWLNNSIWNKNPVPPEEHCELIYKFSHLTVKSVGIDYLTGMKLESGRELDLKDVAAIIKSGGNKQPFALINKLNEMGFVIDISVLLEAYGTAYGMDWLMEFYTENESDINRYI